MQPTKAFSLLPGFKWMDWVVMLRCVESSTLILTGLRKTQSREQKAVDQTRDRPRTNYGQTKGTMTMTTQRH